MREKPRRLRRTVANRVLIIRYTVTQPDEVFQLWLVELAGEDDFDAALAEVARLHNGLEFWLKVFAEPLVAADFNSIAVDN